MTTIESRSCLQTISALNELLSHLLSQDMDRKKSSVVLINDIMDELKDENNRLLNELSLANKCLQTLCEMKCFVDLVSQKLKPILDSNESQNYEIVFQKVIKLLEEVERQRIGWNLKNSCDEFGTKDRIKKSVKQKKRCFTSKKKKNFDNKEIKTEETGESVENNGCEDEDILRHNKPISNNKLSLTPVLPKKYCCEYPGCEYRGRSLVRLNNHKKRHIGDKPHECPECDQTFQTKKGLSFHRFKQHVESCSALVCDVDDCGSEFRYEYQLNLHKWKAHKDQKRFVCDQPGCEYRTTERKRLSDHKNTHTGHTPYECSHCGKRFRTKSGRRIHIAIYHKLTDEVMVCDIDGCGKQFRSECKFKIHQKTSHFTERTFVCNHPNCGFKAVSEKRLATHAVMHSSERPFSCHIEGCGKAFKLKGQLTLHIESHNTELNVKCTVEGCGKALKNKTCLRHHMRYRHSGQTYRCDWPGCDYSNQQERLLKQHSAVHSNDYSVVCIWPQCDKRFKTLRYMKRHLEIHKGDKRHACHWPGCQYRCITPGNLRLHMRAHQKK